LRLGSGGERSADVPLALQAQIWARPWGEVAGTPPTLPLLTLRTDRWRTSIPPKMNRRAFVTGLGAVLAAPLALEAQQPGKVYRIGYLAHISDSSMPRLMEAFRESLASSGWIEGQNITIEYRSAEGNAERLPELARDLVRVGVDVIVALVPGAVLAATKATSAIPIVMVHGPDPVQLHLVGSLARPGGNITGLTTLSADLSAKQFELLKALVPSLTRIAVLSNPTNPWHPLALDGIEARAKSIGVVVRNVPTRDVDLCLPLIRPIGSRRPPQVFVMEPTHARHLHYTALARRLHSSRPRCVLSQG
jgi:ABC-type sugar transport system substrate-binding protein